MPPLNLEIKGMPEKVILIYSPCRSGSTALLNAFSMSETHQGLYQPIKAAVRRSLAGDNQPVIIDVKQPVVIIKETLGPYCRSEVDYDPISLLMERSVHPSALHVVALFREPERCLESWLRTFRRNHIDLSLFGASYEAVYDDCAAAQAMGAQVVPLLYEDLAEPKMFRTLLADLEIPFDPAMLDWSLSDKFRPGSFAFEAIRQPNLDANSFDGVAESCAFVVPRSSAKPSVVDRGTAGLAGLSAARSIYAAAVRWREKPLRSPVAMFAAGRMPHGAA